jgi:hypothetical protein
MCTRAPRRRRTAAFSYLILSYLLVQISGLHLHLHPCSGEHEGREHAVAHYADGGFFFGENHVEDDPDDREVSLPAATFTTANPGQNHPDVDPGFCCLLSVPPAVDAPSVTLTHAAMRSTARLPLSSRPFDLPPARGPPVHS